MSVSPSPHPIVGVLALLWGSLVAHASEAIDFQREIRPILSDNCFHCHGPDPSTRMAGLRLDVKEGAYGQRQNGVVVIPERAEESLLYRRVTHREAAMRMPPAYSNKKLSDDQIELLRRWIEQGAPWSEHWAFRPPRRAQPPSVSDKIWVRNPIDRFILARLEEDGLQPAPEADRRTLIRRVSLDLRGLPPSPDEVEAFVSDTSPNAYDKLVERFLAAEAYGEHRARYWLDAARYGDTHGLHIDNYREMWHYRDWVIRAFNRNVPFDRFTIEQLAGDLLQDPSLEQLIATGFHRCNVTTNEGGVIDEEVAVMYAKDRVDTTGAVWLGLTVGCATCHDHKFDPISQKDFYSLAAFFRNTTQHPRDGNIHETPPVIVVPPPADQVRWNQLTEVEEPRARLRLEQARDNAEKRFEKWLRSRAVEHIDTARFDDSERLALSVTPASVEVNANGERMRLTLPEGFEVGAGPAPDQSAFYFPENGFVNVSGPRAFQRDAPFTLAARVFLPEAAAGGRLASQVKNTPTGTQEESDEKEVKQGWELNISGRRPSLNFHGANRRSMTVVAEEDARLEKDTWHHVAFTYDGAGHSSGVSLYVDGQPIPTMVLGGSSELPVGSDVEIPVQLGGEDDDDDFEGGVVAEFRLLEREISSEEAALLNLWSALDEAREKPVSALSAAGRESAKLFYLTRHDRRYRKLLAHLSNVVKEKRAIRRRSAVTYVMQERPDSAPMAHILERGQYDQPGEQVQPDVPAILPPLPPTYPRDRLGLARWLVASENPLTARVTVNRFWQQVFGTGLVLTSDDFGSQGEAPSHPELLDWLAVEFRESGWDIKNLFRLLVTSAVYRQAATATAEKLEKDPHNRLLSRGPRFRMDAEMVRDYALAASGLLVRTIGGPSVKPYQPERIWETVAMPGSNTRFYEQDRAEKLYRRSLYTFWKRSAPPPSMQIFDAPTREHCTVRRERTNTPLQALVTMNDPQFVEAARNLASHTLKTSADFEGRLDYMAAHLLARPMEDAERAVVERAYRKYMSYYDSHPDEAGKLLHVGDSKPDADLPPAEFAAWTMTANQLLNLDEVLNK